MLLKSASKETAKRLESEYKRLVFPEEMGEIYKVFYVGKENNGKYFFFSSSNKLHFV